MKEKFAESSGCQIKSLHGEHPNLELEEKKGSMAAWPKKKMPPFFLHLSDFFRLVCPKVAGSCWKSRIFECQISYGSAPNARPSHGPSVRMDLGMG